MLRSTGAASVLGFHQTFSLSLSLSGFAWHAFLVLSNLRYLKISLAPRRSPDITMHDGTQSQTHIHTYIHSNKKTTHRASSKNFVYRPSGQCLSARSNGTKQAHPLLIVCDVINT